MVHFLFVWLSNFHTKFSIELANSLKDWSTFVMIYTSSLRLVIDVGWGWSIAYNFSFLRKGSFWVKLQTLFKSQISNLNDNSTLYNDVKVKKSVI
jgi:hypothetical protein